MARTQIEGDSQITDYTIALKDLLINFLGSVDWDITNGGKDATIIGLQDAVDLSSPTTLSQLNAVVASLQAQFGSGLDYKGALDASDDTAFIALAHSKGDFYKISVGGSIAGVNVNVGDMLIINKVVAGGALVGGDIDVIDNTEAADLLRVADVIDSLLSQDATKPLSANQGYELKALIDLVNARVNNRKYGEQLTATQSSPVLPATAQLPISGTIRVYRNGSRMNEGSGNDFTVNFATGVITFEFDLKSNDTIITDYEYN